MAEYIEREALYKEVTEKYHDITGGSYPFNIVAYDMAQLVKNAPAADVDHVVHGRWIHDINNLYGCSECFGRETMSHKKRKPYCPNCGARMDGE